MEKVSYSEKELAGFRDMADVTRALAAVKSKSSRLPDDLIKALLHAIVISEPDANAAWTGREKAPDRWSATLESIADIAEVVADRLEAGQTIDDDEAALGECDPIWCERVAEMRQFGRIPVSVPASILVGALLQFLSGRPDDFKLIEAGEASDATQREKDTRDTVLARAAARLSDALKEFAPEQLTTSRILEQADVAPRDLERMSQRDFEEFKHQLARTQKAAMA